MGRVRFSRTPPFDFETVRAMWYAPFDGADYGEVASAVGDIRRGDTESWFRQWSRIAEMVDARTATLIDPISRGKAALRASNYMRTAEFFLRPDDPRRTESAGFCRSRFDAGLQALGVDATRSRRPYDGGELETIFLRAPGTTDDVVLVVHGGFDSTAEELYFTIGAGALQRGFHVLLYDGPGQGNMLREFGMPFTPEWERPAALAIDALAGHCSPRAILGLGVSFGGHLLARAAAFERRYDGIVLYDYFPGMLDAFRHNVPAPLRGAFDRMPPWMERLMGFYSRFDLQMGWALRNALWTFGAQRPAELVATLRAYDETTWAQAITADVLVLVAEKEHFFPKSAAYRFADRATGARSVTVREFTQAEGGHLHCQNGAIHLAHEVIFDWAHRIATKASSTRARDAPQPQPPRKDPQ
jgi:hypothetical protein